MFEPSSSTANDVANTQTRASNAATEIVIGSGDTKAILIRSAHTQLPPPVVTVGRHRLEVRDSLDTEAEREVYDSLWRSELTLKRNQRRLINYFIDCCTDFSFVFDGCPEERVFLGHTNEKPIIFYHLSRDEKNRKVCINSEKPLIYKKPNTLTLFCSPEAIGFQSMKTEAINREAILRRIFENISKSPLGCEFLRVITAKYIANDLPKLIFVPVLTKYDSGFLYMKGTLLKGTATSSARDEYNFIFFPAEGDLSTSASFININYELISTLIKAEAIILHEIRHSLPEERNNGKSTIEQFIDLKHLSPELSAIYQELFDAYIKWKKQNVYQKTSDLAKTLGNDLNLAAKIIAKNMNSTEKFAIATKPSDLEKSIITKAFFDIISEDFLSNDEELVTMWGIEEKDGKLVLNLLNESPFVAEQFSNHMRSSHFNFFSENTFDPDLIQRFFNALIHDHPELGDLYRLYLDPHSPLRALYPRFGEGNYQYKY